MKIQKLFQYSNAYAFIQYKYPRYAHLVKDIPVVELEGSEWRSNGLSGYGYNVREENIQETKQNMSMYSPEMLQFWAKRKPDIRRDVFIYNLHEKVKETPFFIVLDGHESNVVHEAAHIIWDELKDEDRQNIQLPNVSPEDGDEYMQRDSERFTHMNEMEYFKQQGMSFEGYFKTARPTEHEILSTPNADEYYRKLALLDYRDLKSIWDQIKIASTNWVQKISQKL